MRLASPPVPKVLSMRERGAVTYRLLQERLEKVMPQALRSAGLDMWIILCQEDDPDPLLPTLLPLDCWCPILQILVFADRGPAGIDCINISGVDTKDLYHRPYRGQVESEQWRFLAELVREIDPGRIGVNTGSGQWCAGGLTKNLYDQLRANLPEGYGDRLVSAEEAATVWASTLTASQVDLFEHVVHVAHRILARCLSRETIVPGLTTTDDLEWAYWQQVADLGLEVAFRPFFRVVRSEARRESFGPEDRVIRPGDLVHSDVGIKYLGLNSDHQQWAYILKPGETDAPEGCRRLLAHAHRLQEVFMASFEAGLTGNELLARILDRAHASGIPGPKVYSHSLGLFLHEPGPLIGLPWEQERCLVRGDVVLRPSSAFTMELCVRDVVPEWAGEELSLSCEEDVVFTEEGCRLVDGRQEAFHLI